MQKRKWRRRGATRTGASSLLPLKRWAREARSTAAESHSTEAEKGHGAANTALSAMQDKHQTRTLQAPWHTQSKERSRTGTRTAKASWHLKPERAPRRGKYCPRHGTLQEQTQRHGADSTARSAKKNISKHVKEGPATQQHCGNQPYHYVKKQWRGCAAVAGKQQARRESTNKAQHSRTTSLRCGTIP